MFLLGAAALFIYLLSKLEDILSSFMIVAFLMWILSGLSSIN